MDYVQFVVRLEIDQLNKENRFRGELQGLVDKYGAKICSCPWLKIDRYLEGTGYSKEGEQPELPKPPVITKP